MMTSWRSRLAVRACSAVEKDPAFKTKNAQGKAAWRKAAREVMPALKILAAGASQEHKDDVLQVVDQLIDNVVDRLVEANQTVARDTLTDDFRPIVELPAIGAFGDQAAAAAHRVGTLVRMVKEDEDEHKYGKIFADTIDGLGEALEPVFSVLSLEVLMMALGVGDRDKVIFKDDVPLLNEALGGLAREMWGGSPTATTMKAIAVWAKKNPGQPLVLRTILHHPDAQLDAVLQALAVQVWEDMAVLFVYRKGRLLQMQTHTVDVVYFVTHVLPLRRAQPGTVISKTIFRTLGEEEAGAVARLGPDHRIACHHCEVKGHVQSQYPRLVADALRKGLRDTANSLAIANPHRDVDKVDAGKRSSDGDRSANGQGGGSGGKKGGKKSGK
jgi:hypothetical protein